MKLSISARDEERCDGAVERPVDDSVHRLRPKFWSKTFAERIANEVWT